MSGKIELAEFKEQLSNLEFAYSKKGKKYTIKAITRDSLEFSRDDDTDTHSIPLMELYRFYTTETEYKTPAAKRYVSKRVQSPAVAILTELRKQNRSAAVEEPEYIEPEPLAAPSPEPVAITKSKKKQRYTDETKFFVALSEITGKEQLLSKSTDRPIQSADIFLSDNYADYGFDKAITGCFKDLLEKLKSNSSFSSESLSHHIDGAVINHPELGSRIIEFDEEQHFTPARKETLQSLSTAVDMAYSTYFIEICDDLKYLNDHVLNKYRMSNRLEKIPTSFADFTEWLEESHEKETGYICGKNDFPFLGGRIAQRAYYDSLRDTAHLSDKNPELKAPLRFAKKTFEDKSGKRFKYIPKAELKEMIVRELKSRYKLKV